MAFWGALDQHYGVRAPKIYLANCKTYLKYSDTVIKRRHIIAVHFYIKFQILICIKRIPKCCFQLKIYYKNFEISYVGNTSLLIIKYLYIVMN